MNPTNSNCPGYALCFRGPTGVRCCAPASSCRRHSRPPAARRPGGLPGRIRAESRRTGRRGVRSSVPRAHGERSLEEIELVVRRNRRGLSRRPAEEESHRSGRIGATQGNAAHPPPPGPDGVGATQDTGELLGADRQLRRSRQDARTSSPPAVPGSPSWRRSAERPLDACVLTEPTEQPGQARATSPSEKSAR